MTSPDEIEKRWMQARARMEPYGDAVFWQDPGIDAPKSDELTSCIQIES